MVVSGTGLVTWTPARGVTTSGLVTLRVEDSGTLFDTEDFSIAVSEAALPILTTSDVTHIQSSSAVGGGDITNESGTSVVKRGICWSTSPSPTTSDDCSSETLTNGGGGVFSMSMNSLRSHTSYYVRAFATNSSGTGYGTDKTFKTKTPLLLLIVPAITHRNSAH